MAHQIVIDWDDAQVRALVIERRGSGLQVVAAKVAPLEGDQSAAALVRALEPLVAPHRGPKTETLVVVGGRDVQFRLLRLPPAPVDELPDMVALRSSSEFPIADEQGTIDFFPFEGAGTSSQLVLAARLASKSEETIRKVCQQLHLHLAHIVPQGSASAWLSVRERAECKTGVHVAASLRQGELDLVGIFQGAAAVIRSVPLPVDLRIETLTPFAVRELRRTQAAVASELGVDGIDSIVWHVVGDNDVELVTSVSTKLGTPVHTIDLLSTRGVDTSGVAWPEGASAFTALMGVALADADRSQAIDFLAPRRRVEKRIPVRTLALAGTAAALLLLGGGYWLYNGVASIQSKAAELTSQINELETQTKELDLEMQRAQKVEAWLKTDVNWLDELERTALAQRPKPVTDKAFDAQSDVMLSSIEARTAQAGRGTGGTLILKGAAVAETAVRELDQRLRDKEHNVEAGSIFQNADSSKYKYSFGTTVTVEPEKGNELR